MGSRRARFPLRVVLALAAAQAVLALAWVRPGPLSIDEVLYQWMTRSAAAGEPLTIANGYEELPSPELAPPRFTWTTEGRLTAQYPVLFPLLAVPFYAAAGFLGLFLVNALAFAGVLGLCWRIGVRLLGSAPQALAGCAILAFGTYAWEYSMAAWPHMVTLLFQLAAFDLALTAYRAEGDRRRLGAALMAGALIGTAVGFRRDAVFFLPVVGLPLLFASPARLRALGALALGALPPLALVGWLNGLRWGTWSPLSYGRPEPGYRVLGVAGFLGLTALALLAMPRVRRALGRRPGTVALVAAGSAIVLSMLPFSGPRVLRMLGGVESLLFDLGGFAADGSYEPVVYVGGLKKAALQSMPWLPLVLVTARQAWRDPSRRQAALFLALPAAVYVGIPVFLNRHGGMSVNIRYFIPALPFLALLGAMALATVWEGATNGARRSGGGDPEPPTRVALALAVAAAASALAAWVALRPVGRTAPEYAPLALVALPLALAATVLGMALTWIAAKGRQLPSLGLLAVTSSALAWSAALAFDHDARWSHQVRADNLARSSRVAMQITSPALLFSPLRDSYATVPELRADVIVAFPEVDGYADFRRLATHHLDQGRRVYAVLEPREWTALETGGHLEGLERTVIGRETGLVELRRGVD